MAEPHCPLDPSDEGPLYSSGFDGWATWKALGSSVLAPWKQSQPWPVSKDRSRAHQPFILRLRKAQAKLSAEIEQPKDGIAQVWRTRPWEDVKEMPHPLPQSSAIREQDSEGGGCDAQAP